MSKVLFAVLLSAVALTVFGCGGGDEVSSMPDASEPDSLLVSTDDLSGSTVIKEPTPKMCGPLPIMEKRGGEVAISKMLRFEEAKLAEAVGIFKTPAQAKSAYEDLNERRRFECIGQAIGRLGSAKGSAPPGVEASTPEPLDAGDDGTVVHVVSLEGESEPAPGEKSEPVGSSDVISVQVGRCTMALLVAVEGSEPVEAVAEQTADAAIKRVSGVCG